MTGRDTAEQADLLRIALWLGGPLLIIGAFAVFFICWRFALPPLVLVLGLILLLPATWGAILLVEQATARASHGLITTLHAGNAGPAQTGFSRQEALVAQGRLEEAAVAYRLYLADHQHDMTAWVALARLLDGPLADPDGAATAYRSARQSHPGGEWDRIISNDLIDLYARSNQTGKLQGELARFAELHRGTKAGEAALIRLRELKHGTE